MVAGPKRKRGRPRKNTNDDPWSIHNAPRRINYAQRQTLPSSSTDIGSTSTYPFPSTALPTAPLIAPLAAPPIAPLAAPPISPLVAPPVASLAVPPTASTIPTISRPTTTSSHRRRGRGRPYGSGNKSPTHSIQSVCLVSPWTNEVFDVWRKET